jgi:hypothetical protein
MDAVGRMTRVRSTRTWRRLSESVYVVDDDESDVLRGHTVQ